MLILKIWKTSWNVLWHWKKVSVYINRMNIYMHSSIYFMNVQSIPTLAIWFTFVMNYFVLIHKFYLHGYRGNVTSKSYWLISLVYWMSCLMVLFKYQNNLLTTNHCNGFWLFKCWVTFVISKELYDHIHVI
jgi:hypothetical protein